MHTRRAWVRITLSMCLTTLALFGCDKSTEEASDVVEDLREGSGRIVATVGTVTIRSEDVASVMREDGISASSASAFLPPRRPKSISSAFAASRNCLSEKKLFPWKINMEESSSRAAASVNDSDTDGDASPSISAAKA